MSQDLKKSTHHLAFDNGVEYILIDNQLYKCPIDSPFDTEGNRTGTWECTKAMALSHPDVYPFFETGLTSWQEHVYHSPVHMKRCPTLFKSPVTGTYVGID